MATKVAINGFGRIGRLALRAILETNRPDLQVVALNDLGSVDENAHLFRYDSIHGRFGGTVTTTKDTMDAGKGAMKVLAEKDPAKLPWKDLGVDLVLECTGRFTKREEAEAHLKAGAKRVLVSAPADGVDLTVVYGVNNDKLEKKHTVVSNASCTTNCLSPVAMVLHQAFGIEKGFMTTIHSYTADQRLQDTLHKDPRRARAAALSMIPASSGVAKAVQLVLPELKGKLDGTAIRVPTANVSVIDLKFVPSKKVTVDAINNAFIEASKGNRLKGILNVSNEPLVSSDYNHSTWSSTIDLLETKTVGDNFARVLSWYDNEWGFACRMIDTALAMARLG
ncbi:MAG: type I glyceraldehyde-3-phosphate dehydrogenase [Alphaproteobacteria bacterium]|nr:type I glyceraldehyde-3-phosphate dehydrogenase [Alphaproteobacteria bacterium]